MAAFDPHVLRIDLFKRQDTQFKLNVRFLSWLVTTGRYIIIVVELVVIGAFVARYKLDSDLAAINHEINDSAVPYLKSLQKDEREIRETQLKLTTVKQLRAQNPHYVETLGLISKLVPTTIKLESLNFDKSAGSSRIGVVFNGSTPTIVELSAFIKALQKDPNFSDINLTNFSTDEDGTKFTVTGTLNPKAGG